MAPASSPEPTLDSGRRVRLAIAAVLTALLLVAASLVIGRLSAPHESTPTDTSAEAGFARDMQVHHLQAVDLSMTVRDLTDDAEVRLLAYDIATSQSQQSGQMFGWLNLWGLSQTSSQPAMTWMTTPALDGGTGHDMDTGAAPDAPPATMPGYATAEQLAELRAATGVEAERIYLTLMIAHHKGGVEMAESVIARSTNTAVVALATSMVRAQTSEITVMEDMLAKRS